MGPTSGFDSPVDRNLDLRSAAGILNSEIDNWKKR